MDKTPDFAMVGYSGWGRAAVEGKRVWCVWYCLA